MKRSRRRKSLYAAWIVFSPRSIRATPLSARGSPDRAGCQRARAWRKRSLPPRPSLAGMVSSVRPFRSSEFRRSGGFLPVLPEIRLATTRGRGLARDDSRASASRMIWLNVLRCWRLYSRTARCFSASFAKLRISHGTSGEFEPTGTGQSSMTRDDFPASRFRGSDHQRDEDPLAVDAPDQAIPTRHLGLP